MGANKIIRASKKTPCPVCGGQSWPCYAFANGEVAGCKNYASDRHDRDGVYLHILVARGNPTRGSGPRPAPSVETPKPRPPVAPPDHLHLVYSSLLARLALSDHRLDNLLGRGLTPQSTDANFYRDTPTKEESEGLVEQLEPLNLAGVPGFFMRSGRWRMVGCLPGFFVPYRDVAGRIRGLSYRLDVPLDKTKYVWFSSDPDATFDGGGQKYPAGTKITPPLHFARPELIVQSNDLLLTEGALKSDVAAQLLGLPFVAAAGVTQWGGRFAEAFKHRFPDKRAVVCYDSDWRSNRHVKHALEALMARLRDAGVNYVVRSWPEGKGIDDYAWLLSHQLREVAAA